MATNIPNDNLTIPAKWRGMAPILVAAGAVCVLLSLGLFAFANNAGDELGGFRMFMHSYLANYMFCLSFCLGALFFVMLQHLTRAGWSATIRRLAELFAITIPWWAIMFVPILAMVLFRDSPALYEWNLGRGKGLLEIVENKLGYLDPFWFTLRIIIYFTIWTVSARVFFTMSRKQDDTGDTEITLKLQRWAGPLLILFSLSVNFAAFDMMMSVDPEWFSTIYGVYLFAASMLSFFAVMILTCYLLQRNGRIEKMVTTEHFHDMSKFQFGFIVFWGYIAFSQFLLYWYANIPEETGWYKIRMDHGWQYVGVLLIACHFAIPFLGTMSRHVRRNRGLMAFWAGFILCVHWLDMLFLIMPHEKIPVSTMMILGHLTCWAGMISLFAALFVLRVGETPVVATRDPWLPDALAYEVGP